MHDERSNAPIADVGLVLEGTYPYVMGGVSAWVHQIITGLPDITFSILYIGAKREPDAKRNYELPKNVVAIEEVYLHEPLTKKEQRPGRMPLELRAMLYQQFRNFYVGRGDQERLDHFWTLLDGLNDAEEPRIVGDPHRRIRSVLPR